MCVYRFQAIGTAGWLSLLWLSGELRLRSGGLALGLAKYVGTGRDLATKRVGFVSTYTRYACSVCDGGSTSGLTSTPLPPLGPGSTKGASSPPPTSTLVATSGLWTRRMSPDPGASPRACSRATQAQRPQSHCESQQLRSRHTAPA
mgnify:CR=1 FL=1